MKSSSKKAPEPSVNLKYVDSCPSYRNSHLSNTDDVLRYRTLTAPHVESFGYFLRHGLESGIRDIEPFEIDVVDPNVMEGNNTSARTPKKIDSKNITTIQFWIENVRIARPSKKASQARDNRLLPRECRERGLMYAGPIHGNFCYKIIQRRNGVEIHGKPTLIPRTFGEMPIMVMSTSCHLQGMGPKELVKLKEEVRYFFVEVLWNYFR